LAPAAALNTRPSLRTMEFLGSENSAIDHAPRFHRRQ
jgi:hypothetical protein